MATLKDISSHLGISIAQVSRALNGYDDVSAETRLKVEEAARALNYTPNLSARKLVSGRSGMVGLVKRYFDGLDRDASFLEMLIGLSAEFSKQNLPLIFHVAPENDQIEEVYANIYQNGSLDGFVLTEPRLNDNRIEFLLERNIPFVVHGRDLNNPNHAFVDIDNFAVGYELASHLIQHGHRKIALLNGVEGRGYSLDRLRGYQKAISEAGIEYDEALVRHGRMTESFGMVTTIQLMEAQKPSAIICGHVLIAKGVYRAAETLGLSIPNHISVVAHDDELRHLSGLSFAPRLTVTRAPLHDAWEPIERIMQDRLKGAAIEDCQILLPVEFLERDSVKTV